MSNRSIPLLLTREQAYALIDAWETLNHETEISAHRYELALETTDWLRTAITALGKPTHYTRWQRINQAITNARFKWKYTLLKWVNKKRVRAIYITDEERVALKKFLVLHKSPSELRPVIERLKGEP